MIEFFTSQFGVSISLAVIVFAVLMGSSTYCIYFERKIAAWIQDRIGPNRVGPAGIFQLVADGGKFVFKEDVVPGHVDKPLFVLAPMILFIVSLIGFAVIPWGGTWVLSGEEVQVQVANPDIGLLYILGVAGISIYGLVLGAWASNNKYAFYGGIRAAAQMISYEIPLGLCILVVVVTVGEIRLEEITLSQTGYWFSVLPKWNIFLHPVAFVILFVAFLAEANRAPFDLAEAEQELIAGFHTEYNALKFGLFFLGEYAAMITSSALMAVLFFGGWHLPWLPWAQPEATGLFAVAFKIGVLSFKIVLFIFAMMWVRWTVPRFRFDQLMRLAWKGLIPVTLGLFVLAVVLVYFGLGRTWLAPAGNVVIVVVTLIVVGASKKPVTGRQRSMPPMQPNATAGDRAMEMSA